MWGRMSTTGVGPAGSVDRAEDTVGVVLYVIRNCPSYLYLEQLVILCTVVLSYILTSSYLPSYINTLIN